MSSRKSKFPISPVFIERWSPRSFTGEEIPAEVLHTGFEAARWAPSSGNSQPWRFIFAKRGSKNWDLFVSFLMEGNRAWAQKASALIIVLSKKDFEWNGKLQPAPAHSFDTGAAWMSLALQLHKSGWATHAMGGIERDKIKQEFKLPENFAIEIMIAVGKPGDKAHLPENFQERETPNDRVALENIVHENGFDESWRK
jgi:nitroreductase